MRKGPKRDRIPPLSRAAGEGAGGRGPRRAQFDEYRRAELLSAPSPLHPFTPSPPAPVAAVAWSQTCTREHREARRPILGPFAGIVLFWIDRTARKEDEAHPDRSRAGAHGRALGGDRAGAGLHAPVHVPYA